MHAQADRQTDKTARTTPKKHPRERQKKNKKKEEKHRGELGLTWLKERSMGYGSKVECMSAMKRHKGNPKPPEKGVWVSPAPEKEKKRKNIADEHPNNMKERKKRTTNTKANMGQALKGTKPNSMPSPEKNTVQKKQTKIPKVPDKDPNANT